ncbi:hypothetical protein CPI83_30025 (plasmid) [Rhodococcus sp. H-CA8f]|uniref:hypothetical protein n=1 Tax=Rhodococcus sp. H-CA8f TaxID=1727214 RepID=UPI000BE23E4F|nr:hypothetical protein [Rhodococcus sp. H-CA8f]ATI36438.1 hypothetical protein CPI83_30025 [Rhodococcus sp. H-CA8f]
MNDIAGTESDDREAQSIAVIRDRLVLAPENAKALPMTWQLDRSRLRELSPSTLRRLERRTKAGLANPLHGRGKRNGCAGTEANGTVEGSERAWSIWDNWAETSGEDLAEKLRDNFHRQVMAPSFVEGQTPIPFDSDGPREPTLSAGQAFLSRFETRNLPAAAAPVTIVTLTVCTGWAAVASNFIAGLGFFLCFLSLCALVAAAELLPGSRSLELTPRDWEMLRKATVLAPGPKAGTREYALSQVAVELSALITNSPAWRSETLDVHRIQLNPNAEAAQIIEHAARISELRGQAGARSDGESDSAIRAQQQYDTNARILDSVEETLVARVAALYRYAVELRTLDREYSVLVELQKNLALAPDLEELARQTGADVVAAININTLTGEIEGVQSAIEAQISVLSGDLNALKTYAAESE